MLVLSHVTPMSFHCIRTHFTHYLILACACHLCHSNIEDYFQAKLSFITTWFLALSRYDPTAPLPSCRLILLFHAAYFGLLILKTLAFQNFNSHDPLQHHSYTQTSHPSKPCLTSDTFENWIPGQLLPRALRASKVQFSWALDADHTDQFSQKWLSIITGFLKPPYNGSASNIWSIAKVILWSPWIHIEHHSS